VKEAVREAVHGDIFGLIFFVESGSRLFITHERMNFSEICAAL